MAEKKIETASEAEVSKQADPALTFALDELSEKVLAKAREQAEKIIAEAYEKARELTAAPTDADIEEKQEPPGHRNRLEEPVFIMLSPAVEGQDTEIKLTVNQESMTLRRGMRQKIPRKFLSALESAHRQEILAVRVREEAERQSHFDD